jgi:hypothetical protein
MNETQLLEEDLGLAVLFSQMVGPEDELDISLELLFEQFGFEPIPEELRFWLHLFDQPIPINCEYDDAIDFFHREQELMSRSCSFEEVEC